MSQTLRSREIETEGGVKSIVDFQKRCWVAILYPDNPKHNDALQRMSITSYCLLINHDRSHDKKGNLKKRHTHVLIKKTMYLFGIIDNFGLEDTDYHLFHGLKEFYKSFNDYVEYVTHYSRRYKEKYDCSEFYGGLRDDAIYHMESLYNDENDRYDLVSQFIEQEYQKGNYLRLSRLEKFTKENNCHDIYFKKLYLFRAVIDQNNKCLENHWYVDRRNDQINS